MTKTKENLFIFGILSIFALAFFFRIKTYLFVNTIFHDECALAASIILRNPFSLFQALEYEQKAPAIFMILTKLVTLIGGFNLYTIKFIPMIGGLLSVITFYFLSKQLLNTKLSIIIANFLFAINYQLIYWAQKFKPYSFDVFLFTGSILLFTKFDLDKVSYKKCLLYSLLSFILILTSFPCAFVIGGYILYCLLSKSNIKKLLTYCFPIIIAAIIYYVKILYPVQNREVHSYLSYWDAGFLKLNFFSLLIVLKENFNFFFAPNNFVLLGIILFFCGLVLFLKKRNKTVNIILLSLIGVILVSIFRIYPISQRTALYLLPVAILFIIKPLDYICLKKKMLSCIIVCTLLFYFSKYNFSYIKNFTNPSIYAKTDGLTLFPKLIERYNNNDILIINSTTQADFIYYSTIYHFRPKKVILVPIYRYDKDYYYSFMKTLPSGYNYWFIFGWEYSHRTNVLKNCLSHHLETYIKEFHIKVLEEYKNKSSILIKLRI